MAEQIVNEFTVNRPIDEAWPIICDIERIAPCMPGAQLQEIEGDTYRGKVKVKLGPITAQFKGEAHMVERDDALYTAKMTGKGRDTSGRGTAEADIHATAEALSPTSTRCVVTTDLHITGKVAQFGRSVMGDVSKKLMAQFANNLNTMIDNDTATSDDDTTATNTTDETADNTPHTDDPQVRTINGPEAAPVDLGATAGPAILKRLGPVFAVVALLLLIVRRRK